MTANQKAIEESLPDLPSGSRYVFEGVQLLEQESETDTDTVWNVVIIRQGLNVNGYRYYTENALRDIAKLMNGPQPIQCFVNHDFWAFGERDIEELLGWYTDGKYDEAGQVVTAKLHLLTSGPQAHISEMIREAAKRGNKFLVGLSIVAVGEYEYDTTEEFDTITAINDLISTDAVTRPGAGGKFVDAVESANAKFRRNTMSTKANEADKTTEEPTATAIEEQVKNLSPEVVAAVIAEHQASQESAEAAEEASEEPTEESQDTPAEEAEESATEESADEPTEESQETPTEEAEEPTAEEGKDGSDKDKDKDDEKDDEEDDDEKKAESATPPAAPSEAVAESRTARKARTENSTEGQKPSEDENMTATAEVKEAQAATRELVEMANAFKVEKALAESGLPESIKTEVKKRLADGKVTDESIKTAITEGQSLWDRIQNETVPSGVPGVGELPVFARGAVSQEAQETFHKRLDTMWKTGDEQGKPDAEGNHPFSSLREAYAAFKGLTMITRDLDSAPAKELKGIAYASPEGNVAPSVAESIRFVRESRRLHEATFGVQTNLTDVDGTWSRVLSDSMYRHLLGVYDADTLYEWRSFVSQYRQSKDLRDEYFSRLGMFGTSQVPDVAEGAAYPEAEIPHEDEIRMRIIDKKFGAHQPITIEAIIRDDIDAIRGLPAALAMAFRVKQYKKVFNLLANNSNLRYLTGNLGTSAGTGSTAFQPLASAAVTGTNAHPGHGNHQTAALSATSLDAAIRLMQAQKPLANTATDWSMGISPQWLLVPRELEGLAWRLVMSDYALVNAREDATTPNIFKGKYNMTIRTMHDWTDSDNYWVVAAPNPSMGVNTFAVTTYPNDRPQMTVQDDPAVGNVFDRDTITYKTAGYMDAAVLDHRAFVGGLVP